MRRQPGWQDYTLALVGEGLLRVAQSVCLDGVDLVPAFAKHKIRVTVKFAVAMKSCRMAFWNKKFLDSE